jgi:hypothetical protein
MPIEMNIYRNPDAILKKVNPQPDPAETYWNKPDFDREEGYVPKGDCDDWYNLDVPTGQSVRGGGSEKLVDYDEPNHPGCGLPDDSGIVARLFGM